MSLVWECYTHTSIWGQLPGNIIRDPAPRTLLLQYCRVCQECFPAATKHQQRTQASTCRLTMVLQGLCAVHGLLLQPDMQSGASHKRGSPWFCSKDVQCMAYQAPHMHSGSSHETDKPGSAGRMCSAWPTRGHTCWPQVTTAAASVCGTSLQGSGDAHSHMRLQSTRGVWSSCSSCGPPCRKHRPFYCPVEVQLSLILHTHAVLVSIQTREQHPVCFQSTALTHCCCLHPFVAAALSMLSVYPIKSCRPISCAPYQRLLPFLPSSTMYTPTPSHPIPSSHLLTLCSPSAHPLLTLYSTLRPLSSQLC